jgi:hypothetical protein
MEEMQTQKPLNGNENAPRLLHSKAEAAQMLNVSLRTVDNLIAFKELPARARHRSQHWHAQERAIQVEMA